MSINNGGPAFPVFPETEPGHAAAFRGMTLRDYFAAQALSSGSSPHNCHDFQKAAEWAYQMADTMLRAREES